MPRNLNPRLWAHVPVPYPAFTGASGTASAAGTFQYTYPTKMLAASLADLGATVIVPSEITSVTGYAIGVNWPKPPRARRPLSTGGTESGFCSEALIAEIEALGWDVLLSTKGARNIRSTSSSKTYVVTINGLKYAWDLTLPGAGVALPSAALEELGARPAEPGETGLVWGASFPKPPRGKVKLNNTSGTGASARTTIHTFSTFVSNTAPAELPAGWSTGGGKFSVDALRALTKSKAAV